MVYGSPSDFLNYSYHFRTSMSKEDLVRGFTPLGMLECWNIGKMGLETQKYWTTGPPKVEDHKVSMDNILSNPIFHHSTIPLFQH